MAILEARKTGSGADLSGNFRQGVGQALAANGKPYIVPGGNGPMVTACTKKELTDTLVRLDLIPPKETASALRSCIWGLVNRARKAGWLGANGSHVWLLPRNAANGSTPNAHNTVQ